MASENARDLPPKMKEILNALKRQLDEMPKNYPDIEKMRGMAEKLAEIAFKRRIEMPYETDLSDENQQILNQQMLQPIDNAINAKRNARIEKWVIACVSCCLGAFVSYVLVRVV